MVGLIIATSIIGALLVATIVVGAIRMVKMEKHMATLAECLLAYMQNPNCVDIIEDYANCKSTGFNFPNSEGF